LYWKIARALLRNKNISQDLRQYYLVGIGACANAHAKMSLLLFTFIHIKVLLGLTMAFSFGCQKLNAPDLSP
jgi:hypothetical protein